MDAATDIRERLVRLEVRGEHRDEKLDDLARMVGTHADESRAYRTQHDGRHAELAIHLSSISSKLDALTRRDASAEDTGSVLVEGVEAAGAGAVTVLKSIPVGAWYVIGAAVLGAMGLGGAVRPLVEAAVTIQDPVTANDVAAPPTADGAP